MSGKERNHWLLRLIVRYFVWSFLAHHTHRTNATFFHKATQQMHSKELRPGRWHWLAGWQRMMWKVGTLTTTVTGAWLALTAPDLFIAGAITAMTLVLGGGGWWAHRWVRSYQHNRDLVIPLHRTLGRHLGYFPTHASDWVTVPRDYRSEDTDGTEVALPPDMAFPAELKRSVLDIAASKLAVDHLGATWHEGGRRPTVVFRPIPQAPSQVRLDDVQAAIAAAPDTRPVLGLAKLGQVISADLEADSPHILESAGSGGGKSVLARLLIAQFLNRGSLVYILDRKRVSHRWAKHLPGVKYFRDPEEIHSALVALGAEGDRRQRLFDDDESANLGPRVLVVVEEINSTTGKLRDIWQEARGKEEPKSSPAVTALGELVNMGREVGMHVLVIGQQTTARALGGGEVRESFATRCLTRYSVQTWKMLCGELWPMPKSSSVLGRWQIVALGKATECQVAFLTVQEAQALAMAGCPSPASLADQADKVGTRVPRDTHQASLREAFGADYDRLRKAMQRDDTAPVAVVVVKGGGSLFDRAELDEWRKRYESRPTPAKSGPRRAP